MALFSSWVFFVILYLIFSVTFTQGYKIATNSMKNAGSLTVLIELFASLFAIVLIPFFKIQFPTDVKVYIFLGLSIIFYTIHDRLGTTSRKGLEASTYSILTQLTTVFMILAGLLFFKETFIWYKMIGAFLIVLSNILVFYEKGSFKLDKYIVYGILGNLSVTCALFLDVNLSNNFNLPFYVMITLGVPAILLIIFERIKLKDLKTEFIKGNKKAILITSASWTLNYFANLRAYELGDVTIVTPLCSLSVILNVIVASLFLGEKTKLPKKIFASILILIGVILIKGI